MVYRLVKYDSAFSFLPYLHYIFSLEDEEKEMRINQVDYRRYYRKIIKPLTCRSFHCLGKLDVNESGWDLNDFFP